MNLADQKVRDFITAIRNEPLKMYRAYDVSNRVQYQYEAVTHAKDGDPCMRTEYVYDGISTRVLKMKEIIDTWVAATMEI